MAVGTFCEIPRSLMREIYDGRRIQGWKTRTYPAILCGCTNIEPWKKWKSVCDGESKYKDNWGSEAAQQFFDANRQGWEGVELT